MKDSSPSPSGSMLFALRVAPNLEAILSKISQDFSLGVRKNNSFSATLLTPVHKTEKKDTRIEPWKRKRQIQSQTWTDCRLFCKQILFPLGLVEKVLLHMFMFTGLMASSIFTVCKD